MPEEGRKQGETLAALTALTITGSLNTRTKEYLQRFLKKKGYYSGVIDGLLGPASVTAEQKLFKAAGYYNRAIDGQWGKYTQAAMADYIAYNNGFNMFNAAGLSSWTLPGSQEIQWWKLPWADRFVNGLQLGLNAVARYDKSLYPCVHSPRHD